MEHDFVVVIVRSDSGGNGRKTKLVLCCEKSGKYIPYKSQLVQNVTGSRKCGCPFRLSGRPLANGGGWKLNAVCGVHNHDVAENLEGHPYVGRLSVEEKSLLEDMTKNMMKPGSILLTLKDHNDHNVTTIKQYVNNTWIIPHKENFVAAWIDRVMHQGNTTTNRVESVHARLKMLFQDSRGDICNCWDAMNNLIILQHTEVKASFQRSIMNVEHRFNNPLHDKLFGFVSKNAIVHIVEEIRRVEYIGIDTSTYGCILRSTYGLPCACYIAICRLTLRPELDELEQRFDDLDMNGKVAFKYKARELAFSNTTSMCPPPEKGFCHEGDRGGAAEAAAMVLKTELCRFSGAKIYPGKGIRFIRSDSQVFLFANSKCKRYFHNRLKPSKLTWTAMYRKQHKKVVIDLDYFYLTSSYCTFEQDIAQEAVKKRRRTTKRPYSRSIVGATLEVIQKRRSEKPEVRDAAREAALREIKERVKKTKDEKRAKKAETQAKVQKSQGKGGVGKVAAPKGPKLGGGGGKR
ncbi:TRASH domain [Sesbania bispinosa]|nr:TRASH domain [Sesbania bispinosa]